LQLYIDHGETSTVEPESGPSGYRLQTSVLVNMESYASMEFGVAKLEILYQEKLKCIAMSSSGWRCPEIIHEKQLLKARELVSSSVKSETVLDIKLLAESVLCPGHTVGQLPQIYSEKWTRFSEQRLSKKEAMEIFDANAWKSVQFFRSEQGTQLLVPRRISRPGSASSLSSYQSAKHGKISQRREKYLWPPLKAPLDSQGQDIQLDFRNHSSSTDSASAVKDFGSDEAVLLPNKFRELMALHSANYPQKSATAEHQRTWPAKPETSTPTEIPILGAVKPHFTSKSLEDKAMEASNSQHTGTSAPLSVRFANLGILTSEPLEPDTNNSPLRETAVEEPMLLKSQEKHENNQPAKIVDAFASEGLGQTSIPINSQEIVDRNLIKEMISVYSPRHCVYIRKILDRYTNIKLVKIGKGAGLLDVDDQTKARTDIGCELLALDLVLVDLIHVTDPERALKLVYAELENFRAKTHCQHQHPEAISYADEQEHSKWFDIPENVAIESVQMWSGFIDEAYDSAGTLKDKWKQMATLLPKPSRSETQSLETGLLNDDKKSIALHHELRHGRYEMDQRWAELEHMHASTWRGE
jgi:hypothetical protein